MIEAKAFRIFLTASSLLKSYRLNANIKLTLQKSLIISAMTFAYRTWEFDAGTQLLKLRRLQNKFLRTFGKFPKLTPVRELYMAFQVMYNYDYITKLRWQQVEVTQNHEHTNVREIEKGETRHRK
jgi:hypothetical protein